MKLPKHFTPWQAVFFACLLLVLFTTCSSPSSPKQGMAFQPTDADAKVWTFWHWVHGAVSEEGLTADLEAMTSQGIGGAYIFAIRDTAGIYEHQVVTYSAEWWKLVKHCAKEANRLGIELGFNACDGFTTAGGPWISPELSMQKLVWADTIVEGGALLQLKLPQPESYKGYYEDIATYAFPIADFEQDSWQRVPKVSTSWKNADVQYLAEPNNSKSFSTKTEGYIQYEFNEPFTCQTVQILTGWANYQSNRLIIEVSNDGRHFTRHCRLVPPRSGWQDLYQPNSQSVPKVTAKYFRFVFEKAGSEPGAEDIDDAKWTPKLALSGIRLLSSPCIMQFEGKNASIWRIAQSAEGLLEEADCVPLEDLQNISPQVVDGKLHWQAPSGKWKLIRMGHTSTGRENYIGGGARGLECDKFNEEAVRLQFDKWFGEAYRQLGADLAGETLTRLLCDSWECGSQNWSACFAQEFQRRRGYNLMPYLPVMAGIPLGSADQSERLLRDVRETVAELFAEKFSGTMAAEAHKLGVLFVEESNAPTGVVDGMLHHKYVDYPAGEFWFQSPSHDKPNDVLDAVSAAHIYGKPVVQAESFTEIRLDWNETPAMLKPYADRNLAIGINKIVNHVYVHNPWLDRKPGTTLDKIGNFLQRDQTWWNMSYGFWDYLENCQKLLQQGVPQVDIAVFTGEEIPRRALLPDRLVNTLPGLFGAERVDSEQVRLTNENFPKYEMPRTVSTMANMARPENWIDPLQGYNYDSFNKDALLNLAQVKDGRIVLPSGMSYALLVIPGNRKMNPHGGERMSLKVAQKLRELLHDGATIVWEQKPTKAIGFQENDAELCTLVDELFGGKPMSISERGEDLRYIACGKGKLIVGPWTNESLITLGIPPDFTSSETGKLAWNHRKIDQQDAYFVANQSAEKLAAVMLFRVGDKAPMLYDPMRNEYLPCSYSAEEDGRIIIEYNFEPHESLFVLFGSSHRAAEARVEVEELAEKHRRTLSGEWELSFRKDLAASEELMRTSELFDWSKHPNESIRHYSGEVIYRTTFQWEGEPAATLSLGELHDVAEVKLNGKTCGVLWTAPYELRLKELKRGENSLEVKVANTWHNRLLGDHGLPLEKRSTWTTAPYRLEGQALLPAGLLGPVVIGTTVGEDTVRGEGDEE